MELCKSALKPKYSETSTKLSIKEAKDTKIYLLIKGFRCSLKRFVSSPKTVSVFFENFRKLSKKLSGNKFGDNFKLVSFP